MVWKRILALYQYSSLLWLRDTALLHRLVYCGLRTQIISPGSLIPKGSTLEHRMEITAQRELPEHTTSIVAAYVDNNTLQKEHLSGLIADIVCQPCPLEPFRSRAGEAHPRRTDQTVGAAGLHRLFGRRQDVQEPEASPDEPLQPVAGGISSEMGASGGLPNGGAELCSRALSAGEEDGAGAPACRRNRGGEISASTKIVQEGDQEVPVALRLSQLNVAQPAHRCRGKSRAFASSISWTELMIDGVKQFADASDKLLGAIETQRRKLAG